MAGKRKPPPGAEPSVAAEEKPAEQEAPANGIEVLGTVKRVVRRPVTNEDRAAIDEHVHGLIETGEAIEKQIRRAKKALAKLKKRQDAITARIADLHGVWKEPTLEEIAECRVERTSTEIRIVRSTGEVIYARPLTREEHEALTQLPGMPDAPKVHHPELDANDDVSRVEKAHAEAAKERGTLEQRMTFEEAVAEVDREEEEAEDESATKGESKSKDKGSKAKGKKNKQTEMFSGESEGSNGSAN